MSRSRKHISNLLIPCAVLFLIVYIIVYVSNQLREGSEVNSKYLPVVVADYKYKMKLLNSDSTVTVYEFTPNSNTDMTCVYTLMDKDTTDLDCFTKAEHLKSINNP